MISVIFCDYWFDNKKIHEDKKIDDTQKKKKKKKNIASKYIEMQISAWDNH